MKLAHKIAINVFAGVTGKVLIALLGLLTLGLLTRSLGPTDFGYYRTVLTYLALAGMFAHFGTDALALKEISREKAKQEKVLGSAIALRLVLTLLVLMISAAFAPLFGFNPIVLKGILVGLLGWMAYLVNEVIVAVFYNKLKQHLASAAEVIGTAVTCVLVIMFVNLDMGLLYMLGALACGQLVTVLIAGFFANQLIPLRLHIDRDNWYSLLKAGWPIGASVILNLIILRGDAMLLAIFMPAADVGIYGVGTKIFELLISIPPLFANIMMPLLVQSVAKPEKFHFYANSSLEVMLLASVFIFCVFIRFGNEITVLIAGGQYEQSGNVIRIMAPAIIFVYVITLFRFALTAVGKQQLMFKADVFGLIIAIPAYLILIPIWSYEGAAWARVFTYSAILLVSGAIMLRASMINVTLGYMLKLFLIGLSTVLTFSVLDHFDTQWIISILLGGILYVGLSLLFHIIPVKVIPSPFQKTE